MKITKKSCIAGLGLSGLFCVGNLLAQWDYPPPPTDYYGSPWGVQQAYPAPPGYRAPQNHRRAPQRYRAPASYQAKASIPEPPASKPLTDDDYIRDVSRIVAEADWNKQRTVTVELNEYRYTPEILRLQAGTPYKLELVNRGRAKHYFTAPEFFRAIATRKVQSNHDGEIKAPYFTALEMMANGGQLDLYFVPVHKGSYQVNCTLPGHTEQGMVGNLIIE
jgi:uncharacterized cupredoxin-like copper-binding protein